MAKKEKQERAGRRSIVVPVCHRYQAVVPTWKEPETKGLRLHDSSSKPETKGLDHEAADASKPETKGLDQDDTALKPDTVSLDHDHDHTMSLDHDTDALKPETEGLDHTDTAALKPDAIGLDHEHAAAASSASTPEDTTQWLGTRTWPLEGKKIGEGGEESGHGRPDACGCEVPGSLDCKRLHIEEERVRLRTELGPAFDCWNFETMGEAVAASWTEEQQKKFENIVKRNLPSLNKSFLKPAMAAFSKSREEVVNYYFNVYLPRKFCTKDQVVDSDGEDTRRKSTRGKANRFLVGTR